MTTELADYIDTVHTHTENFIQLKAEQVNDYFVVELTHVDFDGKIKIMRNDVKYVFAFDYELDITPYETTSKSGFISELKALEDTIKGRYDVETHCENCSHVSDGSTFTCINCDSVLDITYTGDLI